MLRAEIEHFLGFCDTADHGTDDTSAPRNQAEGRDFHRLRWQADDDKGAVSFQSVEIFFVVVFGRDGIEDEIEIPGVLLEDIRVGGQRETIRPQTLGIRFFGSEKCLT